MLTISDVSHVSHLAPAFVVSVRSVRIAPVISAFAVELWIVRMVHVIFDLALKGTHVLAVDLESESPECTFPNHTCLCILYSDIVFILTRL